VGEPVPYDDPNINMNDIDSRRGDAGQSDKLFKKDGDKNPRLLSQHAADSGLSPTIQDQLGLRPVPGPVPVDDPNLKSKTAGDRVRA